MRIRVPFTLCVRDQCSYLLHIHAEVNILTTQGIFNDEEDDYGVLSNTVQLLGTLIYDLNRCEGNIRLITHLTNLSH